MLYKNINVCVLMKMSSFLFLKCVLMLTQGKERIYKQKNCLNNGYQIIYTYLNLNFLQEFKSKTKLETLS